MSKKDISKAALTNYISTQFLTHGDSVFARFVESGTLQVLEMGENQVDKASVEVGTLGTSPWKEITFDLQDKLIKEIGNLAKRIEALENTFQSTFFQPIIIHDLNNSKYQLKKAFQTIISQDDNGEFIAETVDFDLYGTGNSPRDAIDDLKEAITVYIGSLTDPDRKLSKLLQSKLVLLKQFVDL